MNLKMNYIQSHETNKKIFQDTGKKTGTKLM